MTPRESWSRRIVLALAVNPAGRLIAGAHAPLAQERSAAAGETPIVRLLVYDESGQALAEHGYPVEGTVVPPASTGTTSGSTGGLQRPSRLEDLVTLDGSGTMVALEISREGRVRTAHLYEFTLLAEDSAPSSERPIVVEERLLVDIPLDSLGGTHYQGMTLGPILEDGRQSLVLVSDNDLGASGIATIVHAYALRLTA